MERRIADQKLAIERLEQRETLAEGSRCSALEEMRIQLTPSEQQL
jgi:hypothetical protein